MKRGEIYYIQRRDALVTGSEIAKARPAVIVSHNALNATSNVVEVVYLTTQPKKDLPTHAVINSSGVRSIALCEQIDHVSITLVGDYCGTCTEAEMADIDRALRQSLGLLDTGMAPVKAADPDKIVAALEDQLRAMRAERDRYARMLDILMQRGD